MSIISIAIQKGGSGKTTTAINLSAAFQQMGRSVLLIDLDPQANGTQALGLSDDLEPSIYTLLRTEAAGQPVDTEGAIHRVGVPVSTPSCFPGTWVCLALRSRREREHVVGEHVCVRDANLYLVSQVERLFTHEQLGQGCVVFRNFDGHG